MSRKPVSYVGITGFKHPEQPRSLLDLDLGARELMVGVLASYRSLVRHETKSDGRSPQAQDIAAIFPAKGYPTVNLVHYYTGDQRELAMQLDAAMGYGGANCHGLQLNIAWPDPKVLEGFRRSWPGKRLVLQVGNRIRPFESEADPATLARRVIGRYAGLVDYILLDASAGMGQELSTVTMARYLEPLTDAIETARLPLKMVVAGGLHADNLHLVEELASMFSGLSFDAEGRLHSGPGQLDIPHCRRYMAKAAHLPA